MILADTSVWIDFLSGKETPFRHLLHEFIERGEDICITEIILTEILQGIKDDAVYETTKTYLLEFPLIKPSGTDTYVAAADIYRACRKHGKTVRKTIDCIIAAIVHESGVHLFHNDADFETIKKCVGLKTIEVRT